MHDYDFGETIPIHDYGYVRLMEVMGSDEVIVDSARISYDRRGKSEDRALIRYLLRHRHTSPFEMGLMRFEVSMPIFVARQWVRHRTASINEISARYTQLPDSMFIPEVFSIQSTDNKQGRGEAVDEINQEELRSLVALSNNESYTAYEALLEAGVSREIARGVLPLNIYTKFVWLMDVHNLMHFLHLRLDKHAQQEIREYAEIIECLFLRYFPLTHEAFVDYIRDSYTLSRMEIALVREILRMYGDHNDGVWSVPNLVKQLGLSDREVTEFTRRFIE